MNNKAVDEQYEAWVAKSIWRNDKNLPTIARLAYRAGFTERGRLDVEAVEAALEGGVWPNEDWQGYKAACERIEADIRAIDGGD